MARLIYVLSVAVSLCGLAACAHDAASSPYVSDSERNLQKIRDDHINTPRSNIAGTGSGTATTGGGTATGGTVTAPVGR